MSLWSDRIAAADTPDALVSAVRDYLASLPPDQFAEMPAWIGAMRVKGIDDLAYWQKRLAEEYCDGGALRDAEAAIVSQLLAFFTAACERKGSFVRAAQAQGARALFSEKSIPTLFKEHPPL